MPNILVVDKEFLQRILAGIGELPTKIGHDVLLDIKAQVDAAEQEPAKIVAFIKTHLAPLEAKVKELESKAAAMLPSAAAVPSPAAATAPPHVTPAQVVAAAAQAQPTVVEPAT